MLFRSQEVGQAGRIALPAAVTLSGSVAAGTSTVAVSSTSGMFVGEELIVDTGGNEETVIVSAVNAGTNQITATFAGAHASNAPVTVAGGFASGIVPPSMTNGSTASVLKLYGDINSDGHMVYLEYTCDTNAHNLYRNVMAWNAGAKPAVTASQVLLGNVIANPGGAACFTYQTAVVGATSFVTDVAITLTIQTQQLDAIKIGRAHV